MVSDHLGECAPHRVPRIKGGEWVLEHHLDDPPLLRAALRLELVAIEGDGARIVALQTADDSGDRGFSGA